MFSFTQPLVFEGSNKDPKGDDIEQDAKHEEETPFSSSKKVRFEDSRSEEEYPEKVHRPRHKARDQSHIKVPGGKAAAPKPIKADYDSDDAAIVRLKQQGYTDEWVAKKLADEGRIRYVPRTVSTRWNRLKKAFEDKEEELHDDELSDWHDGEDDMLEKAVNSIDDEIEKKIEKLQAKKWKEVATHFGVMIQKRKYTAKACQERYELLPTDGFLIPIELDDDQEGRTQKRETRIAEAKQARYEAAMAEKADQLEKQRNLEAKKAAKTKAVDKRIDHAEIKRKERERLQSIKAVEEQLKAGAKDNVKQWLLWNRAEAKWARDKYKVECALLNKALGLSINTRPAYKSEAIVVDSSEAEMSDRETDSDEIDLGVSEDEVVSPVSEHSSNLFVSPAASFTKAKKNGFRPPPAKKARTSLLTTAKPLATPKPASFLNNTTPKTVTPTSSLSAPGSAKATPKTLLNPRSVMTRDELELRIHERKTAGIIQPTPEETHAQIVARMDEEDNSMTKNRLRHVLRSRLLKLDGTKAEWVKRLQEGDAADSKAGGEGVKSTDEGSRKGYEGWKEVEKTTEQSKEKTAENAAEKAAE